MSDPTSVLSYPSLTEAVGAVVDLRKIEDDIKRADDARILQEERQGKIDEFRSVLEGELELSDARRFFDIIYDSDGLHSQVVATLVGMVRGRSVAVKVHSDTYRPYGEFRIQCESKFHSRGRGTFTPALLLAFHEAAEEAAEAKHIQESQPPSAPKKVLATIQDGGDAYPTDEGSSNGLSKRDYFAAAAMQALISPASVPEEQAVAGGIATVAEDTVERAYRFADAMIAQRWKREELTASEEADDAE